MTLRIFNSQKKKSLLPIITTTECSTTIVIVVVGAHSISETGPRISFSMDNGSDRSVRPILADPGQISEPALSKFTQPIMGWTGQPRCGSWTGCKS